MNGEVKGMKERTYKLLDGFELIVSEEALFVRVAQGRMPITTSEEVEFDRVLALVDHLQQQLTEKDATIEQLKKQLNAVNEELKDGPQPFMTADDWRDWLFSVLPFLEEGDKE